MWLSRKAFRRIHPVADDDDHPARVARDLEEVAVVVHAALFLSYGPFVLGRGHETMSGPCAWLPLYLAQALTIIPLTS